MQQKKIVIAGIGGVGGYFGALLAKQYENSSDVQVAFLARGAHLKEIQDNGLVVIKGDTSFVARPGIATDDTSAIGIADFIIICTKSYDLESAIHQLKPCIGRHTVLLPLLNGVDSRERIMAMLPDACVFNGCVYIVSQLKAAGVVENIANVQTLYFGSSNNHDRQVYILDTLFKGAGIEAILSHNIDTIVWEKFIFISPTATATSYFDSSIGLVLEKHRQSIELLIKEVSDVARAKGIAIDTDIATKTMEKLQALPYDATSSMHRDFQAGKQKTELDALTGYVVKQAQSLHIKIPTYEKMYAHLFAAAPHP